jgi:hypothetical protein
VERRADRQKQTALRAARLGQRDRAFDGFAMTGDPICAGALKFTGSTTRPCAASA